MDPQTLAAYDQGAAAFAQDWLGQPSPVDLQEIVERFFVRGGNSADIGCGCGREVAWLHANGFSAVGFSSIAQKPTSVSSLSASATATLTGSVGTRSAGPCGL